MANFLIQMASLRNSPPLRQVAGTFNRLIFAGGSRLGGTRNVNKLTVSSQPQGPEPKVDLQVEREDKKDEELWIEKELRSTKGRKKREGPTVIAPQVERAFSKSREATAQDKIESAVVQFLGISFALILLDGLILALSGFLPEAVDAFAEAYLYKSFSPLVLGFLLCSSIYGLWKSQQK